MPIYHMTRNGAIRGEETGRLRTFEAGDEIEAPKGEFDGLPDTAYETTEAQYQTRPMEAATRGKWSLGTHHGGGMYYLLYGGERITDGDDPVTAGRGEDAAQEEAKRLNEQGTTPEQYLNE